MTHGGLLLEPNDGDGACARTAHILSVLSDEHLTNGKVTEDMVGPHTDLLPEFPYVGQPHQSRAES